MGRLERHSFHIGYIQRVANSNTDPCKCLSSLKSLFFSEVCVMKTVAMTFCAHRGNQLYWKISACLSKHEGNSNVRANLPISVLHI